MMNSYENFKKEAMVGVSGSTQLGFALTPAVVKT
jgi:hypothetical protein